MAESFEVLCPDSRGTGVSELGEAELTVDGMAGDQTPVALLFPPEVAIEIDREFGEVVAAGQAQLSSRTLRTQEAAMEAWHRTEQGDLGGEPPPTLIVHGDLDAVTPDANAAALASR